MDTKPLVIKTIKNLDELITASKALATPAPFRSQKETRELTIQSSNLRCPRCGDHSSTLLGEAAFASFCDPCINHFQSHDDVLWFSAMVQEARGKTKK